MDRMGWSFFQRIRAIFFIFCTAAVRRHCSSTLASPRIRQYRAPCSSLDSAKLRSLVLFPSCSFARFVSQVGRYLLYLYPRLQKYFKFLPQLWPPYCFFQIHIVAGFSLWSYPFPWWTLNPSDSFNALLGCIERIGGMHDKIMGRL